MALKTALQKVGTTASSIVENPAESGVVLKVASLFVSNTTGSTVLVDIEVSRSGTSYSIDVGVYLEEGDTLLLKSSAADSLDAVCSYSEVDPTAVCEPLCLE
jgi:hypothetical protein